MSGPKRSAEPPAAVCDLLDGLSRRLAAALPPAAPSGWLVALSGGLDSTALLVALQRLQQTPPYRSRMPLQSRVPLRAVHVDHGLNPRSAQWARDCRRLCRELGVPLTVRHARLVVARGLSVEAAAREARYAQLRECLRAGEVLLTAHHQDDQLETILLQLMRGAGVNGLAAMPELAVFGRGLHLRPLLALSRLQLQHWLRGQGVGWIDDDSNADERFDRNYLRHRVLPLLAARWPAAARVAARSAGHLAEARGLLAELAAGDLAGSLRGRALDLASISTLPVPRQRNLVRAWLASLELPLPDTRHLARVLGELIDARADANPLVRWQGVEVRRYRGRLYAWAVATGAAATPAPSGEWRWARARRFGLGDSLGSLVLRRDPCGSLSGGRLPPLLELRYRDGGERMQIEPAGPRRPVKELLRLRGVLPWMRPKLPLLFAGSRLVAVADLFIAAEFRAQPGDRKRYRLEWQDCPQIVGEE